MSVSVEEWRASRDSRYEVSSEGRVRSAKTGRLVNPFIGRYGYLRFNTYNSLKKSNDQHFVHVWVCEAFHGVRPDGMHAAHENGVKTDCRSVNLAWKSQSDNEADKVFHGTRAWCEQHGMHKLTEDEVREIRARWDGGEGRASLAIEFHITPRHVWQIGTRRSWRGLDHVN